MLDHPRPEPLRSFMLDGARSAGIRHGFFTRQGGVSQGIYAGLNVGRGSADRRTDVAENRRRVAVWLGVEPDRMATPHQIHSAEVITVSSPFGEERPKADGVVTAVPEIAVGVLTADCGPVLFADAAARVVGAAHAGWKGALGGVLEATVASMEKLGAERGHIIAVLGPSISRRNYEVGPEFIARFVEADAANESRFTPSDRPGHAMFDLPGYTISRLAAAGVTAENLDRCTYAEEDLFYSYRRATHRAEPDYGRQISAIVVENE